MFQRHAPYISRLPARSRSVTSFLYICLILSLTWYESSLSPSADITAAPASIAGYSSGYGGFALKQGAASSRLPSLLTSAPKLPPSMRLRPENRDNDPPSAQFCWAAAEDSLRLSSLRIDPAVWDSGPPSFLLPSAYGLVRFSIPPPSSLA